MIPVGDTVASLVDAGTGLEFSETWYARFYRHNRQAGGEGGLCGRCGRCGLALWVDASPPRGTQSLCGRARCAEEAAARKSSETATREAVDHRAPSGAYAARA